MLEQLLQTQGSARLQDDGKLLNRFLSERDEDAFRLLVERHGPMVMGVCQRVLRNQHDAEEAFQTTFLALAVRGIQSETIFDFPRYLYGIARHQAQKLSHANYHRQMKEQEAEVRPEAEPSSELAFMLERLDLAVESLPTRLRELIILCDLEGRTQRSVAEQLQLPHGTVSGRLNEARKRLHERLAKYLGTTATTSATILADATLTAAVATELIHRTVASAVHANLTSTSSLLTGSAVRLRSMAPMFMMTLVGMSLAFFAWDASRPPAQLGKLVDEPPILVVEKQMIEWSLEHNRPYPVWQLGWNDKSNQSSMKLLPGRSIQILPDVKVFAGGHEAQLGMVYSSANHATFLPDRALKNLALKKPRRVDLSKNDPQALGLFGLSHLNPKGQTIYDVVQIDRFELGLGPAVEGPLEAYVIENATVDVGYFGSTWARRLSRDGYGLIHEVSANKMYFGTILQAGQIRLAPADLMRKSR